MREGENIGSYQAEEQIVNAVIHEEIILWTLTGNILYQQSVTNYNCLLE